MNKQEIEKMFEEKVTSTRIYDEYKNEITDKVYDFIFEEVIIKLLKEIIDDYWSYGDWCWCCWTYTLEEKLTEKAKELYNITL